MIWGPDDSSILLTDFFQKFRTLGRPLVPGDVDEPERQWFLVGHVNEPRLGYHDGDARQFGDAGVVLQRRDGNEKLPGTSSGRLEADGSWADMVSAWTRARFTV